MARAGFPPPRIFQHRGDDGEFLLVNFLLGILLTLHCQRVQGITPLQLVPPLSLPLLVPLPLAVDDGHNYYVALRAHALPLPPPHLHASLSRRQELSQRALA